MKQWSPGYIDKKNITGWQPEVVKEKPDAATPSNKVKGTDFISYLKELQVGSGDKTFRIGAAGVWAGSEQFSSAPLRFTFAGAITASSLTVTGGTISYGKTSFTDSTNAGYILNTSGVYVGSASDAKYIKYTIADGTFTIKGTLNILSGSSGIANLSDAGALATLSAVGNAYITDVAVDKLTAGTISSKSIVLAVTPAAGDTEIRASIASGDFANAGAASGFIIGIDDSDSDKAKFYFGDGTDYIKWDGSVLTINSAQISAPTLTGIASGSEIAIQGWQSTLVFSATDADTVAWATGVITLMNGVTYNITGANTGNMAALTYIYLDIAVSTTLLQTTTTAANAVGSGKILIAVAQNNTDATSKAKFQVFGGTGGVLLTVDSIAANSASTNEFVSNTAQIKDAIITNAKISDLEVGKLTAGTITSKAITLAIADGTGDAKIQAGKTDFTNTENGFILGIDDSDSDKAKFYIGDATTYLNWDGATLAIKGSVTITAASGYANISDKPTALSGINATEGTKLTGIEAGADVTSTHTAALIAGQGALATADAADFSTQVSGAEKPANNATVGATFGTNIAGGGSANTQITNTGYASLFRQDKFGNGADGDVTISANTDLTADMFYNNLTINTGITLSTKGFRIFVKGTLNCVGTGKIASNGGNGGNGGNSTSTVGGTAGTAGAVSYSSGTLPVPLAGATGSAGASGSGPLTASDGTDGTDQVKAVGAAGVAGGSGGGGTVGGGNGGAGGTAGAKTGTILDYPKSYVTAINLFDKNGTAITQHTVSPSSGGGGGGGAADTGAVYVGGGGGGGSGATGGFVWIAAKSITNINIEAEGGNGGNGGNGHISGANTGGAGGGGAGGSGGVIILIYETLTASSLSVAGGSGGITGAVGNAGSSGTDGNTGTTIQINI